KATMSARLPAMCCLPSSPLVTPGLDPGIHRKKALQAKTMDCRVKPGNDGGWVRAPSPYAPSVRLRPGLVRCFREVKRLTRGINRLCIARHGAPLVRPWNLGFAIRLVGTNGAFQTESRNDGNGEGPCCTHQSSLSRSSPQSALP